MKNKLLLFMNKKSAIVFIVFFTFILFALAGLGWHFYKEEIDLFYTASQAKSLKDLLAFFLSGNVSGNAHPTNYVPVPLTFLTSFYRPLLFVFAFIQYSLLGMQPYAHYLFSIALHCVNIPLMFYLLRSFVSPTTAVICSALFAIHPSFATWLGSANMQQYTISTTCIIILVLFFKKYLEGRCRRERPALITSLMFFAVTLFIRETIIVAPVIFIWLSIMHIIPWKKAFNLAALFTLATIPYITAKLIAFPLAITTNQPTSFTNLAAKTTALFLQLQLFLYDFLGISWFPHGYPKLKLWFVAVLLFGLVILFFKNTRKANIIAALGCMALLLWPAILVGYFVPSRFFYEATPCYIIALAFLLEYTAPLLQKHFRAIIEGLVVCSLFYTAIIIRERTIKPTQFYQAIMKLKDNQTELQGNPLCFFGLTSALNWTGIAQQLWLYGVNNHKPIFTFPNLMLHTTIKNPASFVVITAGKTYFRVTSQDAEKVWFTYKPNVKNDDDQFATVTETTKQEKKLLDIVIKPKSRYFYPHTTFIAWNYTSSEFCVLRPAISIEGAVEDSLSVSPAV